MARATTVVMQALVALGMVSLGTACEGPTSDTAPLNSPADPAAEGPPPPPEGAFLAQMPPPQTSQLTSLGVEVVVPGQVPPSFSIVELRVDQSDTGPGYLVVYQNAAPAAAAPGRSQCFAVEFASEGIGDPPATESRLPMQPPLFGDQGYGLNYGPFADADLRAQFPQSNLFTDWMVGPSGAYRLVGAAYIGDLFDSLGACQDISVEEAKALAESFTVLSDDPMGEPAGSTP